MQKFLAASTCFLYLVAAGLFSKGVWHLEANEVRGFPTDMLFDDKYMHKYSQILLGT